MGRLNKLYLLLLHHCLAVARDAVSTGDSEWCERTLEFIHNLPDTIADEEPYKHQFFWNVSRTSYLRWVASSQNTAAHRRFHIVQKEILDEIQAALIELGLIEITDGNSIK